MRQGDAPSGPADRRAFCDAELADGFRLACQTMVRGPMVVEVPESSLVASYHQILADVGNRLEAAPDPCIRKQYVELPVPDRTHDAADLIRLEAALGPLEVELDVVRQLPQWLRQGEFRGTAVLAGRRLLDFEPGNTAAECYGAAFDIGTTTVVGMLLDLNTGETLAVGSRLNPQTRFGDDVLTRIAYAQRGPQTLSELQAAILQTVDGLLDQMTAEAGIPRERIYEVTFAGNTTMQQLLAGIDPRWLGEVPFVPAISAGLEVDAASLGVAIHPRGRVYLLPVIGGFVGGDTVAGILATGLADLEGPSLLVDIGTNGEIVLVADGKLSAAATAAGPAFEGARIEHGMRGTAGAIERVSVDGQFQCEVIGNVRPSGLCGSALIDLAAELLRHGLISPEGRMRTADDLPQETAEFIRQRVGQHNGQLAFQLAAETETATGRAIVLTQRDVRQLQLASGAIRAGIVLLLRRAGYEPRDLKHVFLAGGFGNFLRRRNAQRMGLLPPEIDAERIRYEGNTALAGARLVALSSRARELAEALARRTEHVDLATDHGFQWTFADAMIFPEG